MYELQLVNNGFLEEYNEDNRVFVESILLDSETREFDTPFHN